MNLPEKEFFLQRCADFFDKLASESADVGLVPIVTAFDGRAEFDEGHGRKWATGGILRVEFGMKTTPISRNPPT